MQTISAPTTPKTQSRLTNDISTYLAHTVAGRSMRQIAAEQGRQPSTVLRTIRRIEARRDDPLFDRLLSELETEGATDGPLFSTTCALRPPSELLSHIPPSVTSHIVIPEPPMTNATPKHASLAPSAQDIAILRRLSEPDAFLMVAKGSEKAGVFCRSNQFRRPLALITLNDATDLLRRDWVKCIRKSDLSSKYEITSAGRGALRRAVAKEAPKHQTGFAEEPSPFTTQHQLCGARRIANIQTGEIETVSVNLGESPLGWLAKRKNAKGEALLTADEVEAGERLREDFEMAQVGPKVGQDWSRFLTGGGKPTGSGRAPSEGPMFARERVAKAVDTLGPGLSDVALRVCCFLEGLEATEKRMGWAARSGKVVLKLALQRLVGHYGITHPDDRAA